MVGRLIKIAMVLAVATLVATAVAGCGTSDSATTSTTQTAASQDTTAAGDNAESPADDGQGEGKKSDGEASEGGSSSGPPVEDLTAGVDNSIQTFGREASDSEREAASEVLEAYQQARESGDHETVCASLSKKGVEQLEDLAKTIPKIKGDDCIAIFVAIDKQTPPSARTNQLTGPIASLRVKGDRAFALFRGKDGNIYTIEMARENGWRVQGLVPYGLS